MLSQDLLELLQGGIVPSGDDLIHGWWHLGKLALEECPKGGRVLRVLQSNVSCNTSKLQRHVPPCRKVNMFARLEGLLSVELLSVDAFPSALIYALTMYLPMGPSWHS